MGVSDVFGVAALDAQPRRGERIGCAVATAVLRVDEPLPGGSGFPISLTAQQGAGGPSAMLASGVIDAALAAPSPPLEVGAGESTSEATRRLIVGSPCPQ